MASVFVLIFLSISSFLVQTNDAQAADNLARESFPTLPSSQGSWISWLDLRTAPGSDFKFFRHRENGDFDATFGNRGVLKISPQDPIFRFKQNLGFSATLELHDIFNNRRRDVLLLAFTETYGTNPAVPKQTDLVLIKYDAHGRELDQQFGEKGIARFPLGQSPSSANSHIKILVRPEPGQAHDSYYITALGGMDRLEHRGVVLAINPLGQRLKGFAEDGMLLLTRANTLGMSLQHPRVGPNQQILLDGDRVIDREMSGGLTRQFQALMINPQGEISHWNFGALRQKKQYENYEFFLDHDHGHVYFTYSNADRDHRNLDKRTISRILPGSVVEDPHFKPFTFHCPLDHCRLNWDLEKIGRRFFLHRSRWDEQGQIRDTIRDTVEVIELDANGQLNASKSRIIDLLLDPCMRILTTK